LQTATSATGPYLDLIGSKAPYTNCVSSDTQRFFRLNCSGGNVAPKLEFHSSNRLLVLEWLGTAYLQTATNIDGPFIDVLGILTD
jgi:hypothetical protein